MMQYLSGRFWGRSYRHELLQKLISSQVREWEHDSANKARQIDDQNTTVHNLQDQIQHLVKAHEQIAAELNALEEKHEYRNELMVDLATQLSMSTARESETKHRLERLEADGTSLQSENQQLAVQNASLECHSMETVSDLGSTVQYLDERDRNPSFELDDLYKEIDSVALSQAEEVAFQLADQSG